MRSFSTTPLLHPSSRSARNVICHLLPCLLCAVPTPHDSMATIKYTRTIQAQVPVHCRLAYSLIDNGAKSAASKLIVMDTGPPHFYPTAEQAVSTVERLACSSWPPARRCHDGRRLGGNFASAVVVAHWITSEARTCIVWSSRLLIMSCASGGLRWARGVISCRSLPCSPLGACLAAWPM